MTRREKAKEENRARIRAAARRIIRDDGMEKLTMRRLAEEAGVSLRTPYNLFGSKTDVLISLLEEAGFDPQAGLADSGEEPALERLLAALRQIGRFFDADEDFYREVYGGIMLSDHPDIRKSGVERVVATCQHLVRDAVTRGELSGAVDAAHLGRHLAIQLLAVLGMWGSGFFSNRDSILHTQRAWCGVLLQHCSAASRPALLAAYGAALSMEIQCHER